MRVALLCDVDQRVYHVGDEAIFTAEEQLLRARGHTVVRLSRQEKTGPGQSPERPEIPALVFPWPLEDRTRYLAEIRAVLDGRPEALDGGDKLFGFIEAMRDVDALVIGGGGGLNSRYGWLLSERLATALVARSLGLPVILSGQTLGPELMPSDRALLGELLELCTSVAVRDMASLRLARSLVPEHPRLGLIPDDALALVADIPQQRNVISVTLGADPDPLEREPYLQIAATALASLVSRTGASIELLAHMADPDDGGGDLALHEELAERLDGEVELLPLLRDVDAVQKVASARWVLTTRFHPAVLGAATESGVLALPLNHYGRIRTEGAFETLGLRDATVPCSALWDPVLQTPCRALIDELVDAVVADSEGEAQTLREGRQAALERQRSWWHHVDQVLRRDHDRKNCPGLPEMLTEQPAARPRFTGELTQLLAPYRAPDTEAVEPSAPPAPAVAIIMRTRNRPTMLDRALQDVISQSRQDWELVIVNDCGDRAIVEEVVDRYAELLAGRARVLHRTHSTGMEQASNVGIAASSAPLLVIHDDDDTWSPLFLQDTIAELEARPEVDAAAVQIQLVYEREISAGIVEEGGHIHWGQLDEVRLLEMMQLNRTVPIGVLYRRSLHEAVGPYDESFRVVGDYEFYLRAIALRPFAFVDRPLAQWRHRLVAHGDSANSMYAQDALHISADRRLRDRALREWTDQHGIGLPLFIAHTADRQSEQLQEMLADLTVRLERIEKHQLQQHQAQHSAPSLRRGAREVLAAGAHHGARVARRVLRRLRG
ncbi:polysaccharide pyruvyl transferase family protein [Brachybacterium sp. UMB0905]|uniref:polysaccharide pyruvyl transferase family protein n=1 Tax=Brachybacterium sp. UMB0905 TaxID=2069310 RepID=UPI000C803A66|nr:polysaccharide pyruvyl transferase family protein [Brachybacterium sp. UMB0905]PMC76217.1 hypothetical protein CJ197_03355 [Brachybacterium sp. UMB0905]